MYNIPKHTRKNSYLKFHYDCAEEEKNKDSNNELLDAISLTSITLTGRNYITYLRLSPENVPIIIKFWDTVSAYNTFINNPHSVSKMVNGKKILVDPETREELTHGFLPRLTLYYEAITQLGPTFTPSDNEMKILFSKYIKGTLEYREKLILRSFLFLEDHAVLPVFKNKGLDIREEAMALLDLHGDGSWLLRQGSIIDTDLCNAIVFSFMVDGNKYNFVLLSIVGYGCYTKDLLRGQILPTKTNNKIALPMVQNDEIFPCIIDLVDHMLEKYKVRHDKFVLVHQME